MEPQALILIMTIAVPGVVAAVVTALNAKRWNIAIRAQRARRSAMQRDDATTHTG
ncbi:hypothetical protein GCM10009786_03850 [Leucobacter alluvii]|uniref:Transmembrane protein n=1 Tax=Leucobacter alluvii TaxID=340321 RepID=A0ABN3B3G3_9MICO